MKPVHGKKALQGVPFSVNLKDRGSSVFGEFEGQLKYQPLPRLVFFFQGKKPEFGLEKERRLTIKLFFEY